MMKETLYKKSTEVAKLLGLTPTQIRNWTNDFSTFIKIKTTGNGAKLYDQKAIDNLRILQHLIVKESYTKEKARDEFLKLRSKIDNYLRMKDSLLSIRERLEAVRKAIK